MHHRTRTRITVGLAVAAAGVWAVNLSTAIADSEPQDRQLAEIKALAGITSPAADQTGAGGRGGAYDSLADETATYGDAVEDDGYYAQPEPTPSSPVEYCGMGVASCFEEEVRYDAPGASRADVDIDTMGAVVCEALDDGARLHDILDFNRAGGFDDHIPMGDVEVGVLMRESAQHICPEHTDFVEDQIQLLVR